MGSMPVLISYNVALMKKSFSPLLAPLCPRETLSPAGSWGAKFKCRLWRAGFGAGYSELVWIPVCFAKHISSNFLMKKSYASISSLSAQIRKSWLTWSAWFWMSASMGWVRFRFCWTLFLFPVGKESFYPSSSLSPQNGKSKLDLFGS